MSNNPTVNHPRAVVHDMRAMGLKIRQYTTANSAEYFSG